MRSMNLYEHPEPLPAVLQRLIHRWRTTPALRRGPAADELEHAIGASVVRDAAQLDELPRGTKLYSRATRHFWELADATAGGGRYAVGTGGGYSYASDFWNAQAPLTIMATPQNY